MKPASFISAVTAIVTAISFNGCIPDGYDTEKAHKTRLEAFSDKFRPFTRYDTSSVHRPHGSDTSIFISAVEFPEEYDWRRDTSYGDVEARIVLFKDERKVMEIAAGKGTCVSAAPDRHHLVGGHIYTEHTGSQGTVIGRDGEVLFSWPEKEVLRGLLVEDDGIYTLGQELDGSGFALRRNGAPVFSREQGCVAGMMTDRADFPDGALYRDSGHLYFCYWRPETAGSGRKAWYVVEDGQETQIQTGSDGLFDIRIKEGKTSITPVTPKHTDVFTFPGINGQAMVLVYNDGTIQYYNPDANVMGTMKEKCFAFSFRNFCFLNGVLYMALTPVEEGKSSFLWRNGAVSDIGIHGFITSVDVSVLP